MNGHNQAGAVRHGDRLAANLADRERPAGQAPGSSDAESNNGVRLDQTALDIEPDFAALDFVIVRPFVQAAMRPRRTSPFWTSCSITRRAMLIGTANPIPIFPP